MSLTYQEIVEKIKSKDGVSSAEITTEQILMLFHDRYLKTIEWEHNLYEFNLIPIENEKYYKYWVYDNFHSTHALEQIVKMSLEGKSVYLLIQDEGFEVKTEVLETEK